jgi:hypothetical protein
MPASLRALKRAIEALGGTVEEPRSGSHWKARHGAACYPIPAHNGTKTEIADKYIRGLCRNLGLDEAALREKL